MPPRKYRFPDGRKKRMDAKKQKRMEPSLRKRNELKEITSTANPNTFDAVAREWHANKMDTWGKLTADMF